MQRKTALSFVVYRRPKSSLSAKNGKNEYDKSKYRHGVSVKFCDIIFISLYLVPGPSLMSIPLLHSWYWNLDKCL